MASFLLKGTSSLSRHFFPNIINSSMPSEYSPCGVNPGCWALIILCGLWLLNGIPLSNCNRMPLSGPQSPLKHPACCRAGSGPLETLSSPAQPLVSAAVGPASTRPAVAERLVINEWLTVSERPLVGGFIQQLVEWWLSCRESKRQVPASSPGPSSSPCPGSLGPGWVGEPGGPGNSLGAVSCKAPEPSPEPLTGLAQALRSWWTSPQSLSMRPNGSCHLHRISLQDWPLPYSWPKEPEAQLVGLLASSAVTARQSLGLLPWGSLQLRSYLLARNGPQRVKVVPWNLACSHQNRE